MQSKTFLDFLPINFRHEKSFLIETNLLDFAKLSNLTDQEIDKILREYPLCTLNNLKKIRAIATFKNKISISPYEAYLLLHCGVGSIKTLSRLTAYELKEKIGRLERNLRVKTRTNITLPLLKEWIERSKQNNESI